MTNRLVREMISIHGEIFSDGDRVPTYLHRVIQSEKGTMIELRVMAKIVKTVPMAEAQIIPLKPTRFPRKPKSAKILRTLTKLFTVDGTF